MTLKAIHTEHAPQAIGPYSQAIAAGPFLYISGQIPIDPQTGTLTAATIEAQTEQVLDNIEAILHAAGLKVEDVVKTEIYLKDMQDFSIVNALYAKRFSHPVKPARQTMQVAKLPLDARIEISCIAYNIKNDE
jgi:2-iminobutanoate/2-iminopropanoate deaminase